MTAEEWKEVEKRLQSLYNVVKLNCDGYSVDICLVRVGQFKNEIALYVNGVVKGEWFAKESEEAKRFFRKASKSLYTQKQKQAYKKMPKRAQKIIGIDIDKEYYYYLPTWTSFNALKRHLIKENKDIVLLKECE